MAVQDHIFPFPLLFGAGGVGKASLFNTHFCGFCAAEFWKLLSGGSRMLSLLQLASCFFSPRWRVMSSSKSQNMNGLDVAVSLLLSLCFQSASTICWKFYDAIQDSAGNKKKIFFYAGLIFSVWFMALDTATRICFQPSWGAVGQWGL